MRIIAILVIIAVVAGAAYWFWRVNRDTADVEERITREVSAFNQSKDEDAELVTASPKDVIVYTLSVQNDSDETIEGYEVEVVIDDITEVATLIDASGANYNAANNSLVWTPLDIPGNGSIEKSFTVRIKDTIPPDSDLVMSVVFGNEAEIRIARPTAVTPAPSPAQPAPAPAPAPIPAPSTPEPPYRAPQTGLSEWLVVSAALILTAFVYSVRRFKLLKAEK
jgi:hypothetical protein